VLGVVVQWGGEMNWYYAVSYNSDNREEIFNHLVNNGLRLVAELSKEVLAPQTIRIGAGIAVEKCFGTWLDTALSQLLTSDDIGQACHYLAIRDDGRILDAEFVAEIMPTLFKTQIK